LPRRVDHRPAPKDLAIAARARAAIAKSLGAGR